MTGYIKTDPWKIVADRYDPDLIRAWESIFSLGNGAMGHRANFEEKFSGHTLQGSYIGGIYYPDKTRVGWWKVGYPEYFAKIINSAFWIGVGVKVNGAEVDVARCEVEGFRMELDMKRGVMIRSAVLFLEGGERVSLHSVRLLSMARTEVGALSYSVTPLSGGATVELTPFIDGDVRNEDANYGEKFWEFASQSADTLEMVTKKTGFAAAWSQQVSVNREVAWQDASREEFVAKRCVADLEKGETLTLDKFVGIATSLNHPAGLTGRAAAEQARAAAAAGFDTLLSEQAAAWETRWESADIEIEGDDSAQQGIRYCIFQLLQSYTGDDSRLNIGPKGYTGEKYGGVTYWDTEAYCLPFYLSTMGAGVAGQLLIYRYAQLGKAIENARKLGFTDGAALYPMVTVNGEECHNEWEITFEEIHRNGAIARAIRTYIDYTGDTGYLARAGLEVLIAIARFWSQRMSFSEPLGKYVILGVTGPNEYENNVNNNWYTNYIAAWCLRYALSSARWVMENAPKDYGRIVADTAFDFGKAEEEWTLRADNLYMPCDEKLGIFLQQDDYLDKEQALAADLSPADRPINQKWSWDRILRSCFIKQADVLQGIYFFEEDFDLDTLRRNFYFYEPRTVHESSLSPCVHAILAARLGDMDKAYEMYLRASRLDLDDYNHENDEGLHITSMAGSWLSVVEGFAGLRVRGGELHFTPALPENWTAMRLNLEFRGKRLKVNIFRDEVKIIEK